MHKAGPVTYTKLGQLNTQNWASYIHKTGPVTYTKLGQLHKTPALYTVFSVACQLNPLKLYHFVPCVYVITHVNWKHNLSRIHSDRLNALQPDKNRSTKKKLSNQHPWRQKIQIKWPITCCRLSRDFCNFMELSVRSGLFYMGVKCGHPH